MKASVVSIGNSKGIRIPSVLLKECSIESTVELIREDEMIIIKPVRGRPREGWDKAFKAMHEEGSDTLVLGEGLEDWEWK